jgi:hypothetical protein
MAGYNEIPYRILQTPRADQAAWVAAVMEAIGGILDAPRGRYSVDHGIPVKSDRK